MNSRRCSLGSRLMSSDRQNSGLIDLMRKVSLFLVSYGFAPSVEGTAVQSSMLRPTGMMAPTNRSPMEMWVRVPVKLSCIGPVCRTLPKSAMNFAE